MNQNSLITELISCFPLSRDSVAVFSDVRLKVSLCCFIFMPKKAQLPQVDRKILFEKALIDHFSIAEPTVL